MEAEINGMLGGIAGSEAYFAYEVVRICDEMPSAETSFVPPLDKTCGGGCRCERAAGAEARPKTTYDCDRWKSPQWRQIGFAGRHDLNGSAARVVYFHHRASWERTSEGCRLTFTIHGDLDQDGVYSTYESTVIATPDGPVGTRSDRAVLFE